MQPITPPPHTSSEGTLTIVLPAAQALTALTCVESDLFGHPDPTVSEALTAIENAEQVKKGNGFQRHVCITESSAVALIGAMRKKQQTLAAGTTNPDKWNHSKVRKTADKIQQELDKALPDLNAKGATATGDDCPF